MTNPTLFRPSSTAILSGCGLYRYALTRTWDASLPPICWVLLNPSTADATADDPTIRRVVGFSRSWGYGGMRVVNLYALRSTDPKALRSHPDPVGPGNDQHILEQCAGEAVVVAWGANARPARAEAVVRMLKDVALMIDCLGVTRGGHPKHPLYLAAETKREVF